MQAFRTLVTVALWSGIVAGFLLSILQHSQIKPLILAAEYYEAPTTDHAQWQPTEGWERSAFTVLFNCLTGFGFALLLTAAMYWQGKSSWRRGIVWSMAGYLVFFVAPSLGLPPELPGADNAALLHRQVWWLSTAISTATALSLLAFGKSATLRMTGLVLLALPHLLGAPHPEVVHSTAPEALQQRFIWLSALCNGLFWLALGSISGWLLSKSPA